MAIAARRAKLETNIAITITQHNGSRPCRDTKAPSYISPGERMIFQSM